MKKDKIMKVVAGVSLAGCTPVLPPVEYVPEHEKVSEPHVETEPIRPKQRYEPTDKRDMRFNPEDCMELFPQEEVRCQEILTQVTAMEYAQQVDRVLANLWQRLSNYDTALLAESLSAMNEHGASALGDATDMMQGTYDPIKSKRRKLAEKAALEKFKTDCKDGKQTLLEMTDVVEKAFGKAQRDLEARMPELVNQSEYLSANMELEDGLSNTREILDRQMCRIY
jgi:hypothetical protein